MTLLQDTCKVVEAQSIYNAANYRCRAEYLRGNGQWTNSVWKLDEIASRYWNCLSKTRADLEGFGRFPVRSHRVRKSIDKGKSVKQGKNFGNKNRLNKINTGDKRGSIEKGGFVDKGKEVDNDTIPSRAAVEQDSLVFGQTDGRDQQDLLTFGLADG